MRLFEILSALADRAEKTAYRRVTFPSGFKVCWDIVGGLSNGDTVKLPFTFSDGEVVILPNYNTGTTIRCIFPAEPLRNTDQFTVYAWDTVTGAWSTAKNLSVAYIAVGV